MLYLAGAEMDGALETHAARVVSQVDGLALTGGSDIAPGSYGEEPVRDAWAGDPLRDRWELALYREALAQGRPVFGLCRGMQLVNVAEGGTLWQDLVTMKGSQTHRDQALYDRLEHDLAVEPGNWLEELFGQEPHRVNTVHHQGIKDLAPTLRVVASSPDDVIEAVHRHGEPWVIGVQWHPEWMQDRPSQRRLFALFIAQAARVAAL